MNKVDLLRMSLSSLWRRKLRTVLTVLGVVVGTASIVVMISLGLGLNKSSMEQIEQYGGLTTITVYPNESGYSYTTYSGGGVMIESSSSSDSSSNEPIRIDDAMMETLSQIEHVEVASPVLSISALAKQGIWEGNIYIRGMSQEALEKMNLEAAEGTIPTSEDELQLFYGNTVITNFYNARTQQYYWETGELPEVDFMNDPMFVIFDMDAYYNNKYGGTDENGTPVPAPKKYVVPACGVMAGGEEEYGENSSYVLCNVNALKKQ